MAEDKEHLRSPMLGQFGKRYCELVQQVIERSDPDQQASLTHDWRPTDTVRRHRLDIAVA